MAELAGVLLAPEQLSAAGIGPSEERFLAAVERVHPGLPDAGRRLEPTVTHTPSSATARPVGLPPTAIVAMTLPETGSMRETVPSPAFATHTEP